MPAFVWGEYFGNNLETGSEADACIDLVIGGVVTIAVLNI
jgi:hypothetical protein